MYQPVQNGFAEGQFLPLNCVAVPNPVMKPLVADRADGLAIRHAFVPVVIDRQGVARYVHYGHDMSDIPPNGEMLAILDELNSAGT